MSARSASSLIFVVCKVKSISRVAFCASTMFEVFSINPSSDFYARSISASLLRRASFSMPGIAYCRPVALP